MALNYDMTRVSNIDLLHEDDKQWQISHSLIWATMSIGMGEITQKNFIEFFARLRFVYALLNVESDITVEDVQRRIGLSTNVSDETELQFVKRIGTLQLQTFRRTANSAIERTLQDA